MEIVWSREALLRAEEIGDFIAKDSPANAAAFIDRLIASVDRLNKFPHSGSVVPENLAFRQVVFEGYRIIYRITADNVEIVTVISPGLLLK